MIILIVLEVVMSGFIVGLMINGLNK